MKRPISEKDKIKLSRKDLLKRMEKEAEDLKLILAEDIGVGEMNDNGWCGKRSRKKNSEILCRRKSMRLLGMQ